MQELTPGVVLKGRYKVLLFLSREPMKVVYKVADIRFPGRYWTLTQIDLFTTDLAVLERYQIATYQVFKELLTLNHPKIAKVVDYFIDMGSLFIVSEHVEGLTLRQYLNSVLEPMAEKKVLHIALQMVEILSYLWSQRLAFLVDVKPSSFCLKKNGELVLIEFAIDKYVNSIDDEANFIAGTIGYIPPEFIQPELGPVDESSYIYTIGAVMYELITKISPQETPFSFLPVMSINPRASSYIERLIHKAVAYNKRDRYSRFSEFKRDLEFCITKFMEELELPSETLYGRYRIGNLIFWGVTVIGMIVLTTLILIYLFI